MNERICWLALAFLALAGPALAQSGVATRAEEALNSRESKAASPPPTTTGTVEGVLTWIETAPLFHRLTGRSDGFGATLGGIEHGGGIAAGPSWRNTRLLGGAVHITASAAVSMAGDREMAAAVAAPHAAGDRLAVGLEFKDTHLARERFYGLGMGSTLTDVTGFALARQRVTGRATFAAAEWLDLSATAGTMRSAPADARSLRVPAIHTRFTTTETPGLDGDAAFAVFSLAATSDYRDIPQNPRRGGRYHVGIERYSDMNRGRHSFTRLDTEFEQHLSAWKRQRMVTVRAIASTTIADAGHQVPFYLQRSLGGSHLLRGFVTDRFRDRALVAMQAEYAWDISPFLNAVLFYETGAVAPRLADVSAGDLRRDYGIGFRFGSARTVALRTDVALGSGEGARLTMRFNHAF
jgi:outer membrane protein assembly factor BamA